MTGLSSVLVVNNGEDADIDVRLLKCIANCCQIKNLMVSDFGRDDGVSLLRETVSKFSFQLDIFVFAALEDDNRPCIEFFNEVGLSLLKSQHCLKVLAVDVVSRQNFREPKLNEYSLVSVNEAGEFNESEKELLNIHQSLEYFRMNSGFVLLNKSPDGRLLHFMKFLETEYGWGISQFDYKAQINVVFDWESIIDRAH